MSADFNNGSNGPLSRSRVEALFGADFRYTSNPDAVTLENGLIVQRYVPNSQGSERVEFASRSLGDHDEAWLTYDVYFDDGFEWVKGGKLPGLAGGDITTGGNGADGTDGFSARLAWRPGGNLIVYAYHPDRPSKWGEDFAIAGAVETGQWYRIVQRVAMNTPDASDGSVEIWVNGELQLSRNDIRWRTSGDFSVETFMYSSFYGGSSSEWAPSTTTSVRFDNFAVTTAAPEQFER